MSYGRRKIFSNASEITVENVVEEVNADMAAAQKWVKETGISYGTKPNTPTTRAEVWEMLYRTLGK